MKSPETCCAPEALEAALKAILLADGCSEDEAAAVADHLVEASLSGHDSHGVIRIGRYHAWLRDGRIRAQQPLRAVLDTGALIQFDGGDGMGQWLAHEAIRIGLERVQQHGIAIIALRRAGHIGRLGRYAEEAARAGCASIHFVNVAGSRLVAPFGSSRRAASTAPMAVGIPTGDDAPFILDFATSLVAEGKALVAGRGGAVLPGNALIDADGHETGDPRVLYGDTLDSEMPDPRAGAGALRTMGEHKGSGLALACELLAGALTGNGTNGPTNHPFGNGLLSILIDPSRLDDLGSFAPEVADYIRYVRESEPASGRERVMVPGDKERATAATRRRTGLTLPGPVIDDILRICAELNLDITAASLRQGENKEMI